MKFNQHSLLAFILLTLILGLLFLLGNWSAIFRKPADPVTIAVSKTPLSAPIYIADEKGYFDERCAKVKLMEVIGGNRSFEAMISGEAEFATSSDSVMVFKSLVRNDFANLATFVQSDNDVKFVTLERSGIQSSFDLAGKKVGVTKGAAGEYFLSTYLALGGISVDQIERVYLSPDKMFSSLAQNQVDVIAPWEPYAYQSLKALKGQGKILPSKNLYTLTFNLLVQKNRLASLEPSALCVLQGMKKAVDFIALNPKETQQIIVKRLGLDQAFIDWVWHDYIFKLGMSRSLVTSLESQARWAINANLISPGQVPEFDNFLNGDLLRKVDPLSVTIE